MGHDALSRHSLGRRVPRAVGAGRARNLHWMLVWAAAALLVITAWSYWSTMADLLRDWQTNEDYSAGQLVPLVALLFLWVRRKQLRECVLQPCWWGGITLLVLAHAARMCGLLLMSESAQRYSLVLTAAGLVLLVTGWQVLHRVSWTLLFLLLMVPLPGPIHNRISGPLQRLATSGSVFVLEVFLGGVNQEGNVILINGTPLAVAEACSGLRMLTAFIIVAAFIAYMVKRPRWQKTVLLLSSIPVAVMCNIIRIVATAVLMVMVSKEVGEKFFHDLAGVVMMPAAVLLLFGEIWLMDKLVVPEPPASQSPPGIVTRRKIPAGQ
jgi:exosortase